MYVWAKQNRKNFKVRFFRFINGLYVDFHIVTLRVFYPIEARALTFYFAQLTPDFFPLCYLFARYFVLLGARARIALKGTSTK